MTEDDSRREETLSQLCLEAHQEFKNGSYRKALLSTLISKIN